MSSTRFEIYRQQVMLLARSLVIKFHAIGDIINTGLLINHGHEADATNKASWKYYQNLAGIRHVTDNSIAIGAFDDGVLVNIEFTRENLTPRETTLREYKMGTRFYENLADRFPEQLTRIHGVLYPLVEGEDTTIAINQSVEKAISAYDGEILRWADGLVEENETNLIPELQKWVNAYYARWYNSHYTLTDDMYLTTFLAMMYSQLPTVIMNIRLANSKTNMAHSYHIREYLDAHYRLGEYVDYLDKYQALWLMRNIKYIQRNAGTEETFRSLVENILTRRNLPLAGYQINHDLFELEENMLPTPEYERSAINFKQLGVGTDFQDTAGILYKERHEGISGIDNVEALTDITKEEVSYARDNRAITKVLECSVLDTTDAVAYPLTEVLLYNWVYRSTIGKFDASVFFTNPGTGDRLMLTTKDAFILYLYCFHYAEMQESNGDPRILTTIPTFSVQNILRSPQPTLNHLRQVVDLSVVNESVLEKLLANPLDLSNEYLSTGDFYDDMILVQQRLMRNRHIWLTQGDFRASGYVQGAAELCYTNYECELALPGTTYAEWLEEKGIDLTGVIVDGYRAIYLELFANATGAGENTSKQLREIQNAMINIMKRLSSYTVQYLKSINTSAEIVADLAAVKPGNVDGEIEGKLTYWSPVVEPSIDYIQSDLLFNQMDEVNPVGLDIAGYIDHRIDADLTAGFEHGQTSQIALRVKLPDLVWSIQRPTDIDLSTRILVSDFPEYGPMD